jgi:hypothetical protein
MNHRGEKLDQQRDGQRPLDFQSIPYSLRRR